MEIELTCALILIYDDLFLTFELIASFFLFVDYISIIYPGLAFDDNLV